MPCSDHKELGAYARKNSINATETDDGKISGEKTNPTHRNQEITLSPDMSATSVNRHS